MGYMSKSGFSDKIKLKGIRLRDRDKCHTFDISYMSEFY